MTRLKVNTDSRGFTLVELMISTTIFSIVLLVITAAVRLAGCISKVLHHLLPQEAARSAMEDVSRSLQLTNGSRRVGIPIPPSPGYFPTEAQCIGNTRYTSLMQKLILAPRAVLQNILTNNCRSDAIACTTLDLTADRPFDSATTDSSVPGRELVGTNMRLLRFEYYSGK